MSTEEIKQQQQQAETRSLTVKVDTYDRLASLTEPGETLDAAVNRILDECESSTSRSTKMKKE